MNKKNHQYELDILRIFGMIFIVLFHYTFRGYAVDNMSHLHFLVLGSIFKYGYLGIDLFFMLSGYTIISSAYNKTFATFISARLLRLYPSFWIAVCLTTTASLLGGGTQYHITLKQFFINLTMLNEYFGIESIDGAYWFMFVILKFYLFVAIIILCNMLKFQEKIAGIWLALSLASTFFTIHHTNSLLIPEYAPFLISGMIFYSARKDGWNSYKSFLVIISLLFSLYLMNQKIPQFNLYYNTELSPSIIDIIILSIYSFMCFVSINKKQITLPTLFITLGASTYPLYLIHQNIGFIIFNNFENTTNKYTILTLTLFLMISVSIMIVKNVDPYIVKFMRKIGQHFNRQQVA